MENKTNENNRILSYEMAYRLTEEDLNNLSAAGTSCGTAGGTRTPSGMQDGSADYLSNDDS